MQFCKYDFERKNRNMHLFAMRWHWIPLQNDKLMPLVALVWLKTIEYRAKHF
jgi:hypothetical protein